MNPTEMAEEWKGMSCLSKERIRDIFLEKLTWENWDWNHFHEMANEYIRDANLADHPEKKIFLQRCGEVAREICEEFAERGITCSFIEFANQLKAEVGDLPDGPERDKRCVEVVTRRLDNAKNEHEIEFWKNVLEDLPS